MLPAGGYVASLNHGDSKFLSFLYIIIFSFLFCFVFFSVYHIFPFPSFPLFLLLTVFSFDNIYIYF